MNWQSIPLLLTVILLIYLNSVNTENINISGNRVLVLLDKTKEQKSYSTFFKSLQGRGYTLTYKAADDPTLSLTEYGEYIYDHLIIFSPTVEEFGGLVDVGSIIDFIDDGHNVLLAAEKSVSDIIREVALECGVDFDEEGYSVIDHFHSIATGSDRVFSLEQKETLIDSPVIVGDEPLAKRKPLLYKGIAQNINEDSPLNFALLTGYDTTYSANPDAELKKNHQGRIGKQAVLLSALQARNNARVVISGSLLFFSDKYFTQETGNEYLVEELSKWIFKERGIIRASNVTHHRVGEKFTPAVYTINDKITYSVVIEEWTGSSWVPFKSNNVQLEFAMLDPYVRTFLKGNERGVYSTTFTIPDVYGVFSFKVDYHQLGYTSISLKTIQSVRPYRHDEYERFIKTAQPYYLSSMSMLVGVFFLAAFLLFTK